MCSLVLKIYIAKRCESTKFFHLKFSGLLKKNSVLFNPDNKKDYAAIFLIIFIFDLNFVINAPHNANLEICIKDWLYFAGKNINNEKRRFSTKNNN